MGQYKTGRNAKQHSNKQWIEIKGRYLKNKGYRDKMSFKKRVILRLGQWSAVDKYVKERVSNKRSKNYKV